MLYLIDGIGRLPYSALRDVPDVLALPGALIAGLFYPQGPHTGHGSDAWAYVVVAANLISYTGLWFVFIRIVRAARKGGRIRPPGV
jgi:hypothetical protein